MPLSGKKPFRKKPVALRDELIADKGGIPDDGVESRPVPACPFKEAFAEDRTVKAAFSKSRRTLRRLKRLNFDRGYLRLTDQPAPPGAVQAVQEGPVACGRLQ